MKYTALNKIKITLASVSILVAIFQYAPTAQALTLSPPRLEITGEPGQLLQGELEIYNEELEERTFYTSAQNFEARGETGTPFFLPNKDSGLASWVSMEESVTLAGKERVKFSYTIQVPQNTDAGGYFAAIFFGTSPESPEEGGQMTIGGKVGTLLFLNVPGDAPEGAGIIEFVTEGGNMFPYLPVNLSYRFSNDGARKVMPVGEVAITDMLGKTAATLNPNASQGNVLPSSIRKFTMVWEEVGQDDFDMEAKEKAKDKADMDVEEDKEVGFFDAVKIQRENFAIGKYTANLALKYGLDQKDASAQVVFYVIPWQLMSLVAGAILILIVLLIIGIKKYNHWLINKVKKEGQGVTPQTPQAPVEVNTIGAEAPKQEPEPLPEQPQVEEPKTDNTEKPKAKTKKTKAKK